MNSDTFICRSEALKDRGMAARFERSPTEPGFVIRVDGVCKAYLNRCPHRGTELDWEPGEVFDAENRYLVCATHGALFEPETGRCVAGPCAGSCLTAIPIVEHDDMIYWRETDA